jgi:uncharacterized alpha-E superfamily protein
VRYLDRLAQRYGRQGPAQRQAHNIRTKLRNASMDDIFQSGLHEFIGTMLAKNNQLGGAIAKQYLM